MDYQALEELKQMAKATNYNLWILEQMKAHLGKRVLEIGAGIGTFTSLLLDRELIIATDVAPNCIAWLNRKFNDLQNVEILKLDIAQRLDFSAGSIGKGLPSEGVDTVICLNVLEHILDDLFALRNIHRLLKQRGKLVLLVPAFPLLYGSLDRRDGHHRRYTKKVLKSKLIQAGFKIEKFHYFNSLGFFAWFVVNRVIKSKKTTGGKLSFYDKILVPPLRLIERIFSPPFGQSLFSICRK